MRRVVYSYLIVGFFYLIAPICQSQELVAQEPATNSCKTLEIQFESLACGRLPLDDYGQLNEFREQNKRIPLPSSSEQRVVYFGDSITANWWSLSNSSRVLGYPRINRGISGQITAQMLLRFRQDVISLHPKIVVILGGTNDIGKIPLPSTIQRVEDNLASMVELAHANGIRVVLASVPPVSDYERDRNGVLIMQTRYYPLEKIKQVNDWIREYAVKNDCIFLDYFAVLADKQGLFKKGFSGDGLHPNSSGYALMEKVLEQGIRSEFR